MEWNYKNTIISIESDGKFYYSINGNALADQSLKIAKIRIDELLKDYYTFNKKDIDNLCKKLDKRETEFVNSIIEELKERRESALLEYGRLDGVLFKLN